MTTRKINGLFCEKALASQHIFSPASFRWKRSGKAWILLGCQRNAYDSRTRHCKVGLRGFKLLTPVHGKRCPPGAKRIDKR